MYKVRAVYLQDIYKVYIVVCSTYIYTVYRVYLDVYLLGILYLYARHALGSNGANR